MCYLRHSCVKMYQALPPLLRQGFKCIKSLHVEEGEPGANATCDVCIYITVHICSNAQCTVSVHSNIHV